jgi:hypothetical protein
MPCEPGRIPSDQPGLLKLIATVLKLAHGEEVIWAIDLNHGGPAAADRHPRRPWPERPPHPGQDRPSRLPALPRGRQNGRAKDAALIGDQARTRKDLQPLRAGDETSTGLRMLTARGPTNPRTRSVRSTASRPSCSNL